MIEQGFELKNVKKVGVNSQSCKFYTTFKCVEIREKAGREVSQFGIFYLP